ncbi:hypothetical protein [Phaeovulum sp. NW3]|uniref:hypothetical protein n=1 Tax=Phaeovulum sp. NW3 TaxID=2934933 RepID=UPI0020219F8A|nr:hypothetical protein [Phaeovulum sp. NW3]MCL7464518.1 hypothetical protein [Phaeovulum sp. NW3]
MTEIHEEARVCPSCGAKKGALGADFTGRELKARAGIVAAIGLLPLLVGLGFLVTGDVIGFMFLAGLATIPFAIAAGIFVASEGREKWYR